MNTWPSESDLRSARRLGTATDVAGNVHIQTPDNRRLVLMTEEHYQALWVRAAVRHPSPASVQLSKRETQIAGLTRSGLSAREIAAALGLAQNTVAQHRVNIRRKLGARAAGTLSQREKQVLRLVRDGLCGQEIAAVL